MLAHRRVAASTAALSLLALAGCATPEPPSTGTEHAAPSAHVHEIVVDPAGDGFLLGMHDGLFAASADGEIGGRIGQHAFDAMGLTVVGDDLLASGHPGPNSPAEWGSPHLGIIRSSDGARSWSPVTFTGEKDFHVLASGVDGAVFGISTDSSRLLVSTDVGQTWAEAGASVPALDLAVDATGRLIAATPQGLQVSLDDGASFTAWAGTPSMYALSSSPDQQRVVGIDARERIWVTTAGADAWEQVGRAHGGVQAVTTTDDGDIVVVDDSGLTVLSAT
jgi:hypothetical protein